MDTHHSQDLDTTLDILGIARIPIRVHKGECVKQLKQRLCFGPGVRLVHDGQLLNDAALVPSGTDIMIAAGVSGGGDGEGMPIELAQDQAQQTDGQLLGSSVKSTTSSTSSRSRCHVDGCDDRPAKIVGDCRYCQGRYCSRHRLPEAHQCEQIEHCRQQSLAKNTDKLMSGKCVADKM